MRGMIPILPLIPFIPEKKQHPFMPPPEEKRKIVVPKRATATSPCERVFPKRINCPEPKNIGELFGTSLEQCAEYCLDGYESILAAVRFFRWFRFLFKAFLVVPNTKMILTLSLPSRNEQKEIRIGDFKRLTLDVEFWSGIHMPISFAPDFGVGELDAKREANKFFKVLKQSLEESSIRYVQLLVDFTISPKGGEFQTVPGILSIPSIRRTIANFVPRPPAIQVNVNLFENGTVDFFTADYPGQQGRVPLLFERPPLFGERME
jgi:hypothetical protein